MHIEHVWIKLAACLVFLPGCGADIGEDLPKEEVETVRSALFDDRCWTNSGFNDSKGAGRGPSTCGTIASSTFYGSTSESGNYDEFAHHPHCPGYIVEIGAYFQRVAPVGMNPAILGAHPDYCQGYWANMRARGMGDDGFWRDIETVSEVGTLQCTDSGCYCTSSNGGGGQNFLPRNHGFNRIRIVAEAGWVYWRDKVKVGVNVMCGS